MTVAFSDIVILRDLLSEVNDWSDWSAVRRMLHTWHWQRKSIAATVNVLSVALYDLFGAEGKSPFFSFVIPLINTLQVMSWKSYAPDASNTLSEVANASLAPSPCYLCKSSYLTCSSV